MLEKIKAITNKKAFHIVMIILIITIILFVTGIIILKYNVEGETNMPFELTKISIISSSDGTEIEGADTKWTYNVYQSNDIYLYIDKNKNYSQTEAIKTVNIENIQIEAQNKENIKIYKPDNKNEKMLFNNAEENRAQTLEYIGDIESSLKDLKISNQGGIVAFRCSNNNLAEYKSNDEEIKHNEFLKESGVTKETIQVKLIFDLIIKLESGKEYQTTVDLDLPIDDVVEQGTTSSEITDLNNLVFKRIKN